MEIPLTSAVAGEASVIAIENYVNMPLSRLVKLDCSLVLSSEIVVCVYMSNLYWELMNILFDGSSFYLT